MNTPAEYPHVSLASIRATASEGRDATIKVIREALKRRSGKAWSVTGGRGTAWGWIRIVAPPARRTWSCRLKAGATTTWPDDYEEYDSGKPGCAMSLADRVNLALLLGYDEPVHRQGESVPASSDYRCVMLCRALFGHPGPFTAEQYWD